MSDKAIFLDRDDTLIDNPGYINHPDQVRLLDSVPEALIEMRNLGYKLIVVSNQSGVARGIVTEAALAQIHQRLEELLAQEGAALDRIYYCPYYPDGVIPKYSRDSECRKPNPGMLITAAREMDIDLGQSWMIGNGSADVTAGSRAGCRTILISLSGPAKQTGLNEPAPDHVAVNIKEAVNIIKRFHREPAQPTDSTETTGPAAPEPTAEGQTKPPVDTIQQTQLESSRPVPAASAPQMPPDHSEQLLNGILEQLKNMQRTSMFSEFSVTRLMAGIVQILVFFCLVVTVWFLMSPEGQDNAVLITLGFAAVLQLMALTFYVMQGRR